MRSLIKRGKYWRQNSRWIGRGGGQSLLGSGSAPGQIADSLGPETDVFVAHFLSSRMLIRDTSTPSNNFYGDINDSITFVSPGTKYIFTKDGVFEGGTTVRTEYDTAGVALGVRSEEARQALELYCRDLTNAAWTKTNTTAALSQEGITGVANSASLLTASANNGTCFQSITSASATRVFQPFVRRVTGSGTVEITIDGGSTYTDITATIDGGTGGYNGFHWIEDTQAAVTDPTIGFRLGTSGDEIAVDFANVTNGTFKTSPILTTSSQVTRNKDQIYALTSALPFNAAEGSLIAKYRVFASNGSPQNGVVCALTDNTVSNRMQINGRGDWFVANGGASQANLTKTAAAGAPHKSAASYKVNDFANSLDGAAVSTDTSGTIPTVNRFEFGQVAAIAQLNGHIEWVKYLPREITDAQHVTEST